MQDRGRLRRGRRRRCAKRRWRARLGYDLGLLSLAALPAASDDELLEHCRAVAREIPLCGFYLQPSVGGRLLSYEFWRRFCEIPAVAAIKVAPFNRYQTLDVVRAVADSGRARRDRALHGQRRQHHPRPADGVSRVGQRLLPRRTAGAVGGVDAARGGAGGGDPRVPRRGRRGHERRSWPARPRSPTRTARCSTCATASPAASRACTRSCGGRACWRGAGASIRRKISRPGSSRRSTACARRTRNWPTMSSCAPIWTAG